MTVPEMGAAPPGSTRCHRRGVVRRADGLQRGTRRSHLFLGGDQLVFSFLDFAQRHDALGIQPAPAFQRCRESSTPRPGGRHVTAGSGELAALERGQCTARPNDLTLDGLE